jgi:hypothetical protein
MALTTATSMGHTDDGQVEYRLRVRWSLETILTAASRGGGWLRIVCWSTKTIECRFNEG